MSIHDWFPFWWTGLIFLLPKGLSRVFSSIIVWNHQFFGALPSLWSKTLTSIPNYWKDHSLDISDVFAFQYTIQVCHSFATVCKCAKSQRPITSQQYINIKSHTEQDYWSIFPKEHSLGKLKNTITVLVYNFYF